MSERKKNESMLPDEIIMDKIYLIRDKKVMLDRDLAKLYDVETRRLKEQVRRNLSRFPENFMFELTKAELEEWRNQFATTNKENMGLRIPPFAFTEYGVLMLANVLKSERAIKMSIRIIEVFVKVREILLTHKDLFLRLQGLEKKFADHDDKIILIFEYLKQLEQNKREELELRNRKRIGFKRTEE